MDAHAKDAYCHWRLKGASPAMAAMQAGVTPLDLLDARKDDLEFHARLRRIENTLDENVETALYQAAMKGNVPAQIFWMTNRRPGSWSRRPSAASAPHGEFDDMSYEELLEQFERWGMALPPWIAESYAMRRVERALEDGSARGG